LASLTIDELKQQRRWLLWRLEPGKDGKPTKIPYRLDGCKAVITNPTHLRTYAEVAPHVARFSGIGIALGEFDGVAVWGTDIDGCCDAVTGKFTPESREIVIGLDSYGEYSPSGTGCHILGIGKLPIEPGNKAEVLVRPHPGCKQIEIKGRGFYFTFTNRHLSKTPSALMERQEQILALYNRVARIAKPKSDAALNITIHVSEEERLRKLMAGDMSDYNDDHSTADFALCILLAKKHGCNAFKIDEDFRSSGLFREKWMRDDYRERTITRAVTAVAKETAVILSDTEEEQRMDDGSPTEYLVEAKNETGYEGWFPLEEISLVGGSSGVGKTSLLVPLLEKVRTAQDVFGHATRSREYRVLSHDRSAKAMRRTARASNLSEEVVRRVIRLTPAQQRQPAAEVLQSLVNGNPGVQAWLIEGLDMWVKNVNDLEAVSELMDSLQRVAARAKIAVIATLGSAKQKQGERYLQHRDSLFGSIAFGRKAETVMLLELHNPENPDSVRRCTVLTRCGKSEQFYFEFRAGEGLCLTNKPEPVRKETAFTRIEDAVFSAYHAGDEIEYQPAFGSKSTFYDWRKSAVAEGKVTLADKKIYVPFVRAGDTCPVCHQSA
jgi:primase-polymerase (primpol)-like protein